MDDDDVDSNLFFDRVYCANPQVRSVVGMFRKDPTICDYSDLLR